MGHHFILYIGGHGVMSHVLLAPWCHIVKRIIVPKERRIDVTYNLKTLQWIKTLDAKNFDLVWNF